MTAPVLVAAAAAVAFVLAPAQGQAPATPQDCLRHGREFGAKRQQELRPLTIEIVRQIQAEQATVVRECAAAFDVKTLPAGQLAAAVELFAEARQPAAVEAAIARGTAPGQEGAVTAAVLAQAVRSTLRQPKSDERNRTAERFSDLLDALPAEFVESKITAHAALNGYYRADDIDAGIVKHSTWLIETARAAGPELRQKFGHAFVAAYVYLAEALAGQGDNDGALRLLRRAPEELSDIPKASDRLSPVVARYERVGRPAAPLAAGVWLNRAGADSPLPLTGRVTLLQFTAHWCGPCKESYPGMKRLEARFKERGLQVVFYTRTYGYFESERNLAREQEIERDKAYYAGYGFTLPIAIGTPTVVLDANGKQVYQEDPVERAYGVGGIPQINVIDAEGNLRLVMIGYDEANEEKLAAFIERLLKRT